MRPQPLICVRDVEASSRWYQRLLNCQSAHGGPEYERLVANGILILQLHSFEVEHHHGPIGDPNDKPYGNGVLLWFELDDFDAAASRATQLKAEVISGTSIDSQDTLAFSQQSGVRPMTEVYPGERVSEAYDRMMSGKARFRVVLRICS